MGEGLQPCQDSPHSHCNLETVLTLQQVQAPRNKLFQKSDNNDCPLPKHHTPLSPFPNNDYDSKQDKVQGDAR
jgi:hypothetical protein